MEYKVVHEYGDKKIHELFQSNFSGYSENV